MIVINEMANTRVSLGFRTFIYVSSRIDHVDRIKRKELGSSNR